MALARSIALGLTLVLAACGSQPQANEAAGSVAGESAEVAEKPATLPSCPFQETREWAGSIERGRLLVTGRVDLMMAGFRPQLSPRESAAPGTLALDLALVPEANAAVSDELRYERTGVPAYRRGEIWCGDQRIAGFDMILVG